MHQRRCSSLPGESGQHRAASPSPLPDNRVLPTTKVRQDHVDHLVRDPVHHAVEQTATSKRAQEADRPAARVPRSVRSAGPAARVRRVRSHCGVRIAEPPRFCPLARHLHVRHHVSCYIPAAAAPSRPCSSASGVCAGRDLGSACIVSHLLLSIPDTKQRRL